MRSDWALAGLATVGILFGNIALGSEQIAAPHLALLCGLTVVSDLLALPVPKRGFLSYSFIWVFVLTQLTGPAIPAVVLTISVFTRFVLFGRDRPYDRYRHFLSELLPAQLSLCALQMLKGEASHGFSAGYLASGVSLAVYYLAGRGCLQFFYSSTQKESSNLSEGATQSRELQFRITTMFSPAATLLSSGELWGVLWLLPVLLATHQFFWERLSELREVVTQSIQQEAKLERTESALETQS